jgi:hypothetical protein
LISILSDEEWFTPLSLYVSLLTFKQISISLVIVPVVKLAQYPP